MFESSLTEQSTSGQEVLSPIHPVIISTSGSNFEANHTSLPLEHDHNNIGLYILDIMNFLYPRYNGKPDIETHARSFLNTWNANHVLQRLPKAEANTSRIA